MFLKRYYRELCIEEEVGKGQQEPRPSGRTGVK